MRHILAGLRAGGGLFEGQRIAAGAAGPIRHLDMNRLAELFLP